MTDIETRKREVVQLLLQKGILPTPELLQSINDSDSIERVCSAIKNDGAAEELLKAAIAKKEKTPDERKNVKIVFSYKDLGKKKEIQDFIAYFNNRYNVLEKFLQNRQELQNMTSIARVLGKTDRENVSIIGIVAKKQLTANGNLIFEIEDRTGMIKVFASKEKPEVHQPAADINDDEVVGINGMNGKGMLFANSITLPDIPLGKEEKKSPDEAFAVFLSDLHVGSKKFMEPEFKKFIEWINGRYGNEAHRAMAGKVKYLFIAGDIVDGIGYYPGQEADLAITDIYAQYEECAKLLSQLPASIELIMCPGNHDAVRLSEPQPVLSKKFAKPLWDLPNATFVTNPAVVNIHSSAEFPGFDVMLYHGGSFPYYAQNVESIRAQGGLARADLIMKHLLQRRHLSPANNASLYVPDYMKDSLIVEEVPDFLATGHIHRLNVSSYRSVTTLNCSTWMGETDYQTRRGIVPQPCRAPVVNLKTREIKVLRF